VSCLVLIGLAISSGIVGYRQAKIDTSVENKAEPEQKLQFNFGKLINLEGSATQIIELNAKVAGAREGSETCNLLFLNSSEKKQHWLFKDNKHLILNIEQLRENKNTDKNAPVRALLIEYVSEDSTGDRKLSRWDYSNLILVKPDGTGEVELLHGVKRIFDVHMLDEQYLTILYRKGDAVHFVKFSIFDGNLEQEYEVSGLPNKLE
jgi:hypothetical protein